MSEDGLSPLEETLASYMQVSHLVIYFHVMTVPQFLKRMAQNMEIVTENRHRFLTYNEMFVELKLGGYQRQSKGTLQHLECRTRWMDVWCETGL